MAYLSRIFVYPIKSLDAVSLASTGVLPSGALENDRRFALFDELGQYVNGKRHARVHSLRSSYAPTIRSLTLTGSEGAESSTFHVDNERDALEEWLTAFFGFPVTFRENTGEGFPDDTDSPGPTLISTATLRLVADWFDLSLTQARARFRANIEVDGVPPFWEDQLFGLRGTTIRFKIGEVVFDGINPCQRCIVPARDSKTGATTTDFAKRFVELRRKHFPEWAESSRFNHYFRLAINTRLAGEQPGSNVTIGDKITIIGATGVPEEPAPAATARPTRWSGPLRVTRIYDNTPTVRTFRLEGDDKDRLPFSYLPGQFLNVEIKIDDIVHRRCYTIASTPTRPGYCELTVKREELGTVSRYLHDHFLEGMQIQVSGPGGRFTFAENEAEALMLVGAGVGITPLMSKLRYLTDRKWIGAIHLLYCARTECDIIFKEELDQLAKEFPNVRIEITLTREYGVCWNGLRGRITSEMLRGALPDCSKRTVHICGPVEMADEVTQMLLEIGVRREQIHAEAFGGSPRTASTFGAANENEPIVGTITFADSGKSEPVRSDQTVLEIAGKVGVAIDRGCMAGICGRCKVRLLSGDVTMEIDEVLEEAEKRAGFVLACQAKPKGSIAVDV